MQNKIQIEVLVESSKNCSRSRIVASPYYGMKILVAAASDRANTVYQHYIYIHTCIVPVNFIDDIKMIQSTFIRYKLSGTYKEEKQTINHDLYFFQLWVPMLLEHQV